MSEIRRFFICLSLMILAAVRTGGAGDAEVVPLRTTAEDDRNLRMRSGAPFKIALFADLHFGEDAWTEWGPQQDLNSVGVMSAVLNREQPDFVIYLGDVITANNIPTKNATSYWDQALAPTRAMGVPWCTIFGNHDDMPFEWPLDWFAESGIPELRCRPSAAECSFGGTSRLDLARSEIERNALSRTREGPRGLWPGVSNFVIEVTSSTGEEVVCLMYFFDSGGGSYPEVVSVAQVKWFLRKSGEVNPDSRIPEIIFWHIPSKAYKKLSPKFNCDKQCVGSIFLEDVAAQEAEMGMMKVLEERPTVKAVFVGHNHGLDWCCPYKKLWLCFARHTGYGGYGDWARGARILEINHRPFSLKSWIRMEDGQAHSEVILGS